MRLSNLTNTRLAGPALAALLGLSALLGLGYRGWVASQPLQITGDGAERYNPLALNLQAGNGFSADATPPYRQDVFDVPLYPAFLAAAYSILGGSTKGAVFAQVVMELGVVLLTAYAAHLLNLGRTFTVLTLVVSLLVLPLAGCAHNCLTEILSTFVLTVLLCVLLKLLTERNRFGLWFAAGLLSGFSMLARPELIVPAGLMLGGLFVPRSRQELRQVVLGMMLVILGFTLVTLPWSFWIYRQSGRVILPGQLQFTHVMSGPTLSNPQPKDEEPFRNFCDLWLDDPKYIHVFSFKSLDPNIPADFPESCIPDPVERERANSALAQAKAQGSFEGNPNAAFAILAAEGSAKRSIFERLATRIRRVLMTYGRAPTIMPFPEGTTHILKPAVYGIWLSALGAALVGSFLMLRNNLAACWLLLALVAGRVVLPFITPFGAEPRYLFQTLPAIDLLAAYAIARIVGFATRPIVSPVRPER